jgi:hypothetical protein
MPWEEVQNVLMGAIALMRDEAAGKSWLDGLPTSEDGDLLGICLAIDVVSDATPKSVLAGALDGLGVGLDSRSRFHDAVNNHAPTLRCQSQLMPKTPEGVVYVRILELGDFIEYYLRPVYRYTTDPSDVATVRRLFLRKTPRALGDIRNPWSGRHQVVWVLPQREVLEAIKPPRSADDAATELADRLGLALKGGVGPGNGLELVAVTYPATFEADYATRCRQPRVFDAAWEAPGTLYMSHGREDNWGRTRSCTGTKPQMSERVHPELRSISDAFSLTHVGVARPPATDRSTMVLEAYERLKAAES